jgi:putative ATP-dependent DNA ligase
MDESPEELENRSKRLGESIILPMLEIIKHIKEGEPAVEDSIIEVDTLEEAEEFVRHLHNLGVSTMLLKYEDGNAVIRRIHNATTDKINNYIKGGLY